MTARFAVIDNYGRRLPITNMFDADGDETTDPQEAFRVVAPLPCGHWVAMDCEPTDIIPNGLH